MSLILHPQSHLHHCIHIYITVKVPKYVIINQYINNEGRNNSLNKAARIGMIDINFTSVVVKSL